MLNRFVLMLGSLAILVFSSSSLAFNGADKLRQAYYEMLDQKYSLMPHKETYILPVLYNDNPNNRPFENALAAQSLDERGDFNRNLEAEFQISFSILTGKNIFGSDYNMFVGYTQRSWWQVYNEDWSRPFRETNYAPEVYTRRVFDKPLSLFGGEILGYDLGLIHQSNGQVQELSRSWNRIYGRVGIIHDQVLIGLTLWDRIDEERAKDDNPDIYKYMGHGELDILYKYESHSYRLRVVPGTKHQGYEFSFSSPWKEGLRFYAKASYGYGLSLLDYDHDNRRVGIGIEVANPFFQALTDPN